MPDEGRASDNSLDPSCIRSDGDKGVGCAAGQTSTSTPKYKPIPQDHRECLSRLIEMGRMIRRHDGSYGTPLAMMIPNKIATALKGRRMVVAGFNSEIVPTDLGRRFNAERDNAAS